MKKILTYLYTYIRESDTRLFGVCALLTGLGIFINYDTGLNSHIGNQEERFQYGAWFLIFFAAFAGGYGLHFLFRAREPIRDYRFYVLLFLAPALFSWKMVYDIEWPISGDPWRNVYWNRVVYWPLKLTVVTIALWLTWKWLEDKRPFYGLTTKTFSLRPYVLMLLLMIPLIAAASTQPDFLYTYPKLKHIQYLQHTGTGAHTFLYELSYGSDFFTIELFFRGFLVLAFARWVGKDAILPMAMFYCTIHFGKPMGECISSFFGGLLLGIVTYHTRSIFGGLLVHVGIAWLMEIGGYLGNIYGYP
jgi:hypothetical protein